MTKKEILVKLFELKFKTLARLEGLAQKYNDGWTPDWTDDKEDKWYIGTNFEDTTVMNRKTKAAAGVVYFKTTELAEKAMEDLGSDIDFLFDDKRSLLFKKADADDWYISHTGATVYETAVRLVRKNGTTTNLDIKNDMRAKGYHVQQINVHDLMLEIPDSYGLTYELAGGDGYRIWKLA